MIKGKQYNKLVKYIGYLESYERQRMSSSGKVYMDEIWKLLTEEHESVFDRWREAEERVYDEDEKGMTTKVAQ